MQSYAQSSAKSQQAAAGSSRLGKLLDRVPPTSSRGGTFGEDRDGQPTGKDGARTLGWEEGALSRARIDQ